MNEELKIIIKAVTDSAQKAVKEVSGELNNLGKGAKGASAKMGAAFKGMAKGAAIAVGAVMAIGAALVALGKNSLEMQKEQAKLNAAFEAAGMSAKQASKTYTELYRFLGDSGKATEAAAHLTKLTTSQKGLAEWSKIAQGVYATFGDSLPIESLTEASNETVRVGKVTGTLADALNWAGVSEDEFNAKLATTNSLEEREAMLRSTLNGIYEEAANIYERNNKALLDYNESQAKLDNAMAQAGAATMPLLTALNNLGIAFFTALKPALDAIIPPIATFVNWIAKAVQSVLGFFSALTGKSSSVKAVGEIGKQLGSASSGANKLSSGLGGAEKAAEGAAKALEEAKKTTQGFDELNIVSSGTSASGGSGGSSGGGASAPGYAAGGLIDAASFGTEVEETESKANSFAERIKGIFGDLKEVFAPSIEAWGGALSTLKDSWNNTIPFLQSGLGDFKSAFSTFGGYLLEEFIPNMVNSFSVNLAPILADLTGFNLEEAGKWFAWFGEQFRIAVDEVIIPVAERVETIYTDVFTILGEAWATHGAELLEQFSGFFENIRGHLEVFYNKFFKPIWDNILEVFDDVWNNGLKPLVDNFVDSFLEISKDLLTLYNKTIAPVVNWLMEKILPIVARVVNKIVDIAGDLVKNISNAVSGIITAIKGIVQFITGVFTGDWKKAWEGIQNIFKGTWEAIEGIAKAAWDAIKLVFAPAKEFFKATWDSITSIFNDVKGWFKKKFQEAWSAIKDVFKDWGSFFSGLWNKIKTTFSSLGTKISDAIGSSVKSGMNSVIKSIEDTINKAINLINNAITLINKIPGVSVGKVSKLTLPRLAKGGIVDSATIAMIGERGKEAVIPLENNTEWMDKLADRIAARSNTPTKIVLTVDGKELGWANIHAINNITKQTGSLPLVVI